MHDTSAGDELRGFAKELHGQGITLTFARVRDHVREGMRLGGVEAAVGPTGEAAFSGRSCQLDMMATAERA
jgi:hypothetical protein